MDTITIHRLEVPTHIGITEEERATKQTLKVSVWLSVDTSIAGKSDDIADTVDYEQVANAIKELGKVERNTVEKFAEDVAEEVLRKFGVTSVNVSVDKYILPDTEAVSVTISRP